LPPSDVHSNSLAVQKKQMETTQGFYENVINSFITMLLIISIEQAIKLTKHLPLLTESGHICFDFTTTFAYPEIFNGT